MRVLLLWSGSRSKARAELLREVLATFPSFHPFVSTKDLDTGSVWHRGLLGELARCDACVICLTPEAVASPWVNFEAGAGAGRGKPVCSVLLDAGERVPSGPLHEFQCTHWTRDGLSLLIRSLCKAGGLRPISPGQFDRWVDAHWLELKDPDHDALGELCRSHGALESPFLIANACAMWHTAAPDHLKRSAIWELVRELNQLRSEDDYLAEVTGRIRECSVRAICGQKTARNAEVFYKANYASFLKGNTIERVFFPPESREEAESIKRAISVHLEARPRSGGGRRMGVFAFPPERPAVSARAAWHFPSGFGLTLMVPGRLSRGATREAAAVLVHWGDPAGQAAHLGVILNHPVWIEHFGRLFERVRGTAHAVRDRGWREFVSSGHAHYDPDSFGGRA